MRRQAGQWVSVTDTGTDLQHRVIGPGVQAVDSGDVANNGGRLREPATRTHSTTQVGWVLQKRHLAEWPNVLVLFGVEIHDTVVRSARDFEHKPWQLAKSAKAEVMQLHALKRYPFRTVLHDHAWVGARKSTTPPPDQHMVTHVINLASTE